MSTKRRKQVFQYLKSMLEIFKGTSLFCSYFTILDFQRGPLEAFWLLDLAFTQL